MKNIKEITNIADCIDWEYFYRNCDYDTEIPDFGENYEDYLTEKYIYLIDDMDEKEEKIFKKKICICLEQRFIKERLVDSEEDKYGDDYYEEQREVFFNNLL